MEEKQAQNIKEYLRIKRLQQEDNSEEMIDELYNKVTKEQKKEKKEKDR